MKYVRLGSAFIFASAALAVRAGAQQVFGPWVHSTAQKLDVFVSPTGSNSNSGNTPTSPLQTLDAALALADSLRPSPLPTRGVSPST